MLIITYTCDTPLTKSPSRWRFNLQYIISLVINWHHIVAIIRSTICLVFQASLLCIKFHLQHYIYSIVALSMCMHPYLTLPYLRGGQALTPAQR